MEKEIYPVLIESAKKILIEINEKTNGELERYQREDGKIEGYIPFDIQILNTIAKKSVEWIKVNKADDTSNTNNTNETMKEEVAVQQTQLKEELEELVIRQTQLKEELEELVLSAIGLSYFLRVLGKEKDYFCDKNLKNKEICRWDRLLDGIVLLLEEGKMYDINGSILEKPGCKEVFHDYINCGLLYKMQVYSCEDIKNGRWDDHIIQLDYASLLSEKRKVAIASIRQNELSQWFHVPILIDDKTKRNQMTYNAYEIFEREARTMEEENELQEALECWGIKLLGFFAEINTMQYLHEKCAINSDIQYTLDYMLSNIPTIALYANENANVRINVLAPQGHVSVFLNKNMKRHVLKRIYQKYVENHAQYFITPIWRGYECLALDTVPTSVYLVNGVYMSRQQKHYMLLPIYGENIKKVIRLEEQTFYKEMIDKKKTCELLEEKCDDFFNISNKFDVVKKEDIENLDEVGQLIQGYIRQEKIYEGDQIEKLLYIEKKALRIKYWGDFKKFISKEIEKSLKESWMDLSLDYDYIQGSIPEKSAFQIMLIEKFFADKGVASIKTDFLEKYNTYWIWFISTVSYIKQHCNLQEWFIHDSSMMEFKNSIWSHNIKDIENQKNMIDYVHQNARVNISEKQINGCYENMLDEMIECIIEKKMEQQDKVFFNIKGLF